MLRSFLIQQKGSLVVPYNPNDLDLAPSVHQFRKPCCMPESVSTQLPSVKAIPEPHRHHRKKIFPEEKMESNITAGFQMLALEESRVESYKCPSILPQKSQQSSPQKLVVKKPKIKTTKQNVLCFKKSPRSQQTIPSTLKEIMPESNQPLKNKQKGANRRTQENIDLFTFSSDIASDSMRYSNSQNWMGMNLQSKCEKYHL